jgi:hypothetical protein
VSLVAGARAHRCAEKISITPPKHKMELYLNQNGEQVGPYTEDQISEMIHSGALTRNDIVWHEGLSEWQPLHAVFDLPAPVAPPAPAYQIPRQSTEEPRTVMTNVKQGAIIGGWACFGLGILFMLWSLMLFFLYGPFFLVAFVLSIVAMSQRRVVGGISLLMATLLIPTILGAVLFATRTKKFAEDMTKALEKPPVTESRTVTDSTGSTDTSSSSTPNIEPARPAEPLLLTIGQPHKTDKFTFTLDGAKIATTQLKTAMGDTREGKDPDLILSFTITNIDDRRILRFREGNQFLGGHFKLIDDVDNVIRGVDYGIMSKPIGALTGTEDIQPGATATHIEIFSVPPPKTEFLILSVDMACIGGDGVVKFKIPASSITK